MYRRLGFSLTAAIACTLGFGCGGGAPPCNNKCPKVGATQCSGAQIQTCAADANGCLDFAAAVPCAAGSFCSASSNACVACNNTCAAPGASQCAPSGDVQTCTADANGCLAFSDPVRCPSCQTCLGGQNNCVPDPAVVRPIGTSPLPVGTQVQHIGTKTVGDVVQFNIPAGTDGFSIVSQAVNAQTADIRLTLGGQTFAVPNSVVPELIHEPNGKVFYNDLVNPPANLATALAVYDDISPSTGAFTAPNTTAGLTEFTNGVPQGLWNFTVGDFAHECGQVTNCAGGSATSTYDITVITHPAIAATAAATLDVGIYLVTNSFTAQTALTNPGMLRMVSTLKTIYGNAGLTIAVNFHDVPAAAKSKFATGVAADRTGPCDELDQMFTLSQPNTNELNLFFVDDILQSASDTGVGSVVGIDGTIPGPSSISGTVHSGAVVNASNIGKARLGAICTGAPDFVNCGSDITAYIAAHEGGHFMGLYHTTESFGNTFDPVTDTGQCVCTSCAPTAADQAKCIQNNPTLPAGQGPTQVLGTDCNKGVGSSCDGGQYLMFWILDTTSLGQISAQQAKIMRANPLVR
jgi:hypothetical protein